MSIFTEIEIELLTARLDNLSVDSDTELDNIIETTKMEFKTEYLNCIPTFNGNPTELQRFIQTCESIIHSFYIAAEPNNFRNTFIINSIFNKLQGQARVVVNIQNVQSWEDLKNTLNSHFADQRDEQCLNRDLILLKQNFSETPYQFYDRCLQLLNIICSYIDSHEADLASKNLKREFYRALTLRTFLAGLRDPLGTIIRGMRPNTLNEALQYITQEENIHHFKNEKFRAQTQPQNSNSQNYKRTNQTNNFTPRQHFQQPFFNPFSQQASQNSFGQQTFTPRNAFPQNSFQKPSFPSQPIDIRPRQIKHHFPSAQQVFGRPSTSQNVFRPNKNYNPTYQPTPMSTSTRQNNYNTYRPTPMSTSTRQSNFHKPNFNSQELFNTENHEEGEKTNPSPENPQSSYSEQNFLNVSPTENIT